MTEFVCSQTSRGRSKNPLFLWLMALVADGNSPRMRAAISGPGERATLLLPAFREGCAILAALSTMTYKPSLARGSRDSLSLGVAEEQPGDCSVDCRSDGNVAFRGVFQTKWSNACRPGALKGSDARYIFDK